MRAKVAVDTPIGYTPRYESCMVEKVQLSKIARTPFSGVTSTLHDRSEEISRDFWPPLQRRMTMDDADGHGYNPGAPGRADSSHSRAKTIATTLDWSIHNRMGQTSGCVAGPSAPQITQTPKIRSARFTRRLHVPVVPTPVGNRPPWCSERTVHAERHM